MPDVFADVLIASVSAVCSLVFGWFLRGAFAPPAAKAAEEDKTRVDEALAHLHDLAARVAADVGEHSTRVQEINDELSADESGGSKNVVNAVTRLIQANQRMQEQLDSAEERLREQARKMASVEAQARTDALTGLANRRAFDDTTNKQQEEFVRHGAPVSVMVLDVDHFKKFNDTHGHLAGDEVLRGVARVLSKSMRDIDLVARYGGEEFAVVFTGSTLKDASPAADRARKAIEEARFKFQGVELRVTASVGVAQLLAGEKIEQTVKRADEALYASKKAGRNCAHLQDGRDCRRIETPVAPAKTVAPVEAKSPPKPATSDVDAVTGLSVRRVIEDDVFRRLAEWKRGGAPVSLLLVGVDDLANIVSTYGEEAGNTVLRAATQFLRAAMRDMDHVARFDDDVFALLLPAANIEGAKSVAERLRHAISRCSLQVGELPLRFTVSLGVSQARRNDDAAQFIERTAAALKSAREHGTNRTFIHDGIDVKPVNTDAVTSR